jgi:hypothetical protein
LYTALNVSAAGLLFLVHTQSLNWEYVKIDLAIITVTDLNPQHLVGAGWIVEEALNMIPSISITAPAIEQHKQLQHQNQLWTASCVALKD